MFSKLLDKIEENKLDIIEEFVNSEDDRDSFNDKLMTRQAILHEFMRDKGFKTAFLVYLRKNEAIQLYETGDYVRGKKVSRENLVKFGMTAIIPKLEEKGYNVS